MSEPGKNHRIPSQDKAGHTEGETAGKWTVLAIASIGIFMATLDASIVNISLPKISLDFRVPLSGIVEWVIIAYLVIIVSLLLTLGRLSDMVGYKLLWVTGIGVFTLGSVLCGLAPSLLLLVLFRGLQGLGAAAMMSVSPAMVARAFPGERGRAFGLIAIVVSAGTSAGPTLGGLITDALSWRWIFFVNVPIGICGVIATLRFLTEKIRVHSAQQRFDPVGALLLFVGLTCLMLGLSFGYEIGWQTMTVRGLFGVAVVLLIVFIIYEKRVREPIVDLRLFRNRLFSAALASSFLSFLALFAVLFLMPFYLEELLGMSAERAGILLTAVPVSISLIAPFSGWLSDRFGSRVLSSLGLGIAAAGLYFLSNLTPQSSDLEIIWPLVVAGFGQGVFQSPNNNAIMSSVPEDRLGIASGFLATVRVLGQSSSVALSGAVFASWGGAVASAALMHHGALTAAPVKSAFTHAFHMAMLVCALVAALGVFTSLTRGPKPES